MHEAVVLTPGETLYVGYLHSDGSYQEVKIIAVDRRGDEDLVITRNPATTRPGQAFQVKPEKDDSYE